MTNGNSEPENIFADRFGLATGDLDRLLETALSKGGDYADLYLEYLVPDRDPWTLLHPSGAGPGAGQATGCS
jgi:hypothetical protein